MPGSTGHHVIQAAPYRVPAHGCLGERFSAGSK